MGRWTDFFTSSDPKAVFAGTAALPAWVSLSWPFHHILITGLVKKRVILHIKSTELLSG